MKREYEDDGLDSDGMTVKEEIKEEIKEEDDDGLDKQGTSNNQVTVKTEWDDEEVKVEIKEEEDHDIFIKQEFVSAYIKTESSDVKIEIKEEDDDEDHEDDCGCGRFVVKKEEVSDDDDNSMLSNLNEPMDTSSRDQVHTPTDSLCAPSPNELMQLTNNSVTEQANMDQVMSHENGSGHEQDLDGGDEMASHDGSVVASNEPSTSARARSNRVTSKQSTASTARKLNKRKQSQPNRTGKRSKKSVEVNDDGEDEDGDEIVNEDREDTKVKILHLNCTQSNCNVKLNSLVHLHDHLRTVHQLAPLQCFATNCNARFDNKQQIRDHIKLSHSRSTLFDCTLCHKESDSQMNAYDHWYKNHLTGQFECNLVRDCAQVSDTRGKMRTHQHTKRHYQLKHFHCTHHGCSASFAFKADMKRHQQTHLATNQFHCNWPHCIKQFKLRGNLVQHIRTKHFGLPQSMKAQKEKNIVDLRDPNEYVRVVVDE